MENPIKIRCHRCQDYLTEKEQKRYFRSNRIGKATCYQCNMDIIKEQRSRWRVVQAKQEILEVKN